MKTELEQQIEKDEQLLFIDRKNLKEREVSVIKRKVELREKTMEEQYRLFINKLVKQTQEAVYLNPVLLKSVITSYYYDIHRYKDFSGSKWANQHKQAAYTIKWILRVCPIQIKENTRYISDEIFDINLKFAIVCGFAFLGNKVTDLIMKNKQSSDLNASDEKEVCFYDALMYDLRYRQLSGKKLILAFEALELVSFAKPHHYEQE
jgi:hypothetical protein